MFVWYVCVCVFAHIHKCTCVLVYMPVLSLVEDIKFSEAGVTGIYEASDIGAMR